MRCPIPSQNRHGPSCPRGGQWRRLPPPIEGPVLAHSTVRVWIPYGGKNTGIWFGWYRPDKGDCHSCFLFCGASSFSWSFPFMHFERALVIMSDALPPRTVSARDIMFILPWFLVACRANSSNVSASSCPRDLAFVANSSKVRSRRASLGLFWDAIKRTFSLRSGMSSSFSSPFYVLCPLNHSSPYRLPLHPEIHIFCIKMKKDQDLFA